MRNVRLRQSTPFRLAVAFGLLVITAFLTSGAVTYQSIRRELSQSLDASVTEMYAITASSYGANDAEDLVATVDAYVALKTNDQPAFSLTDKSGTLLAGNFKATRLAPGLATLQPGQVGLDDEARYRVFVGAIGENQLVVGRSLAETSNLETIVLAGFGWALVLVIPIAVAGGIILASRAQKRLDGIASTMIDVSNGRMQARIPLRGNRDDIDIVSDQINQSLDRIANLVESLKQISADIAHELKTPLNRLRMTIETAIDESDCGHPIRHQLVGAIEESDHISDTFEALLRISQIEAGSRRNRFRRLNLSEIVANVADIYADVAEENGQSLKLFAPLPSPCPIIGDRELLTQALVNLVENAITHCRSGTTITLTVSRAPGWWTVVVDDNGPGIPEVEHDKVFRRLYRLEKSRTTPGNGLGLSLVRAVTELHSGEIELADNRPGLRVTVMLPEAIAS